MLDDAKALKNKTVDDMMTKVTIWRLKKSITDDDLHISE